MNTVHSRRVSSRVEGTASALPRTSLSLAVRALLLAAMFATVLVLVPIGANPAQAQEGGELLEVWGKDGGIVSDPKIWSFRESDSAANDLGTATAAAPGLDLNGWSSEELRWKERPGGEVANHFRKTFTLDQIGVELSQIEAIRVSIQYDDTAVMYLNGTEVYRSIRGNLDPGYDRYALGEDIPFDVNIPYGGAEEFYVQIPDLEGVNECEESGDDCDDSPYGGPNPPEIPVSLLNADGVNTWGITTWNQSGSGSGDSSLDHTFSLVVDSAALAPNPILINEVMASNDTAFGVQLDDDPELEFPDWFELRNTSDEPVNLEGWTIADNADTFTFPSVVVPAEGYLVVVANDKNRIDTDPLQTNFKLSREGDSLRLVRPDGFVADEFTSLPQQIDDTSYGRAEDDGPLAYLEDSTPGDENSDAGDGYDPILRLFPDRIFNVGDTVSLQANAFDPDGDDITYTLDNAPPGTIMNAAGLITGVVNTPGTVTSEITVTDSDDDSVSQTFTWTILPAVSGPYPILLNEYNAVASDRVLADGGVVGNGGNWFEFVVLQDNLDLRGYSIDLFDFNGKDDQLQLASTVTFGDDSRLSAIRAGTIITISEQNDDDLSFDAGSDWNINLNIDATANGAFFAPAGDDNEFGSTRNGQAVLIKDASGALVAPLSGETDAWDAAGGGVSGAEVMNLCVNPTLGMNFDPIADYSDGSISTFGMPNTCVTTDPNDPANQITTVQDLSALRLADPNAAFACSARGANVSWTNIGRLKYWIYKSTDNGATFSWIGRTTGVTNFTDPDPTAGAIYQLDYEDGPRAECDVEPFACSSDAGVLTWSDDAQPKYWIYKSTDNGATFTWIGRTFGATTFADAEPTVGAKYQVHYDGIPRIACDIESEPAEPEPFECFSNAGSLSWDDAGADKYWIYKSTDGGASFSSIGRTLGATTFTDPAPIRGALYQVDLLGSPRALCVTTAEPSDGGGFSCNDDGGVVTFTDAGASLYWIYRSVNGGATFQWVGRTLGDTTFNDPNPRPIALYQVQYEGIPRINCTSS